MINFILVDIIGFIIKVISLLARLFSFILGKIFYNNKETDALLNISDYKEKNFVQTNGFSEKKENVIENPSQANPQLISSSAIYLASCAVILIAIWVILWNTRTNKPPVSNETFVNIVDETSSEMKKEDLNNIFQSGQWISFYIQYSKWHGPHTFSMYFDHETLKINGTGTDDVGDFSIDGIYSLKTGRLDLTKVYQKGTGSPYENFGHTVVIQVKWNVKERQFDGKWYVNTRKYCGQDFIKFKFNGPTMAINKWESMNLC